jgi:hypothetical protein
LGSLVGGIPRCISRLKEHVQFARKKHNLVRVWLVGDLLYQLLNRCLSGVQPDRNIVTQTGEIRIEPWIFKLTHYRILQTDPLPKVVRGNPDPKHVSTSYVERQNLSMRMSIRRFTRLTNAFSKKVENRAAAVAIWFMYYNFCRVHQTLSVTPAMDPGIADRVWSVEELCGLLPEPTPTNETD